MVIRIQKIQGLLRNICLQLYVGCYQLDAEKSKSVFKHRNKETEEKHPRHVLPLYLSKVIIWQITVT